MRWVVLVVCASGCFSIPPFRGGDGGLPRDDGDGTVNKHDEDNDGLPDSIDNCPVIPTPIFGVQIPDSDGDGIGDDCDPEFSSGMPDTARFYSFESAEIPNDLVVSPPTVMFTSAAPDTIDLGSISGDVFLASAAPYSVARVIVGFEVRQAGMAPLFEAATMLPAPSWFHGSFPSCQVKYAIAGEIDLGAWDNMVEVQGVTVTVGFETIAGRLDALGQVAHQQCDLYLTAPAEAHTPAAGQVRPLSGFAGFTVTNSIVRLSYLYIAGRP